MGKQGEALFLLWITGMGLLCSVKSARAGVLPYSRFARLVSHIKGSCRLGTESADL